MFKKKEEKEKIASFEIVFSRELIMPCEETKHITRCYVYACCISYCSPFRSVKFFTLSQIRHRRLASLHRTAQIFKIVKSNELNIEGRNILLTAVCEYQIAKGRNLREKLHVNSRDCC